MQEVSDFVDFLLSKQNSLEQEMRKYFPVTEFEPPDVLPIHRGWALTLEKMDTAVAKGERRRR